MTHSIWKDVENAVAEQTHNEDLESALVIDDAEPRIRFVGKSCIEFNPMAYTAKLKGQAKVTHEKKQQKVKIVRKKALAKESLVEQRQHQAQVAFDKEVAALGLHADDLGNRQKTDIIQRIVSHKRIAIGHLLKAAKLEKGNYYYNLHHPVKIPRPDLHEMMRTIFSSIPGGCGYLKMHNILTKDYHQRVSAKSVRKLMNFLGLESDRAKLIALTKAKHKQLKQSHETVDAC